MRKRSHQVPPPVHREISGGPDCRGADVTRKDRVRGGKAVQRLREELRVQRTRRRLIAREIVETLSSIAIVRQRGLEVLTGALPRQPGREFGDGRSHVSHEAEVQTRAPPKLFATK